MTDYRSNVQSLPGATVNAAARNMPHNLPAEQNLLGAILLDNSVIERIDDRLINTHFYDPLHGKIFSTIKRVIERGQLANPVTLKSFFDDSDDRGEDIGSYISELADGVISITQAPDYASIVHEAHIRRQLILIGDQIIQDASQPKVDVPAQTQIESAEAELFRLAETDAINNGLRGFESIISASIRQADQARKSDGHLSGTSTGLTDLNNLLGGLHRSDLIIIAGRPAMGKTALATNIAFHAATTTRSGEESVPVAFFSLEMAAEQLGTRILAERAQVDSEQIRRGKLNSIEFDQLVSASNVISSAPFFIDDTPSLSVSQLASRARRMKRTSGLGLIVVDYLQLLTPQLGVRSENRVQEISNISRTLKAIAKDLNVPVIALSQLSRAVEMREDKRPNLADLRESGSIEQDADVVMFVYREEYYLNKREPERKIEESEDTFNLRHNEWYLRMQNSENKAEIIVAKQRHGPTGAVQVHFEKRFTHFTDLTERTHLPEGF
ncbi:MAG: replicative DNA helicase [Candidatus Puniceispirillum sp.]